MSYGFVVRAFSAFDQVATQIRRRFCASLMQRVFAALPWLYEGALDRPAPGASGQALRGHDHALRGGHPISRNLVFSADIGSKSNNNTLYQVSPTLDGNWHAFDHQALAPVVGQPWHFQGNVSPGIDSNHFALDAAPIGLEGYVFLYAEPTNPGTVDVRIKNVTEGAEDLLLTVYSESISTIVAGPLPQWYELHFEEIPCLGNTVNQFVVEYTAVGILGAVHLGAIVVSETRQRSEPAARGVAPIWNLPNPEATSSFAVPLVHSLWGRQAGPAWVNSGTGAAGDYDPSGAGGGTDPSEIVGLPGYEFDGGDDRLQDAKSPFSGNGAFTMGCWCRLDRVDTATNPQSLVAVGIDNGGSSVAFLAVGYAQDGDVALQFGEGEGAVSDDDDLIQADTWHFIVATKALGDCTAANTHLYVDGAEVPITCTDNTPAVSDDSLCYGAMQQGAGYLFHADGEIAAPFLDPSVYSAAEILALYTAQKDGFPNP